MKSANSLWKTQRRRYRIVAGVGADVVDTKTHKILESNSLGSVHVICMKSSGEQMSYPQASIPDFRNPWKLRHP